VTFQEDLTLQPPIPSSDGSSVLLGGVTSWRQLDVCASFMKRPLIALKVSMKFFTSLQFCAAIMWYPISKSMAHSMSVFSSARPVWMIRAPSYHARPMPFLKVSYMCSWLPSVCNT